MEYDKTKIDEMVLALLYLNMFEDKVCTRTWKSFNWDSMNRLYEKGYIADPKNKAKSVVVTEEGKMVSEQLFKRFFATSPQQ